MDHDDDGLSPRGGPESHPPLPTLRRCVPIGGGAAPAARHRGILWRWLLAFLLGTGLGFAEAGAARLAAPQGVYTFKAFGPDQGLLNTSITAMVRDQSGQLWVGTEDGLYRLEGAQFRRFGSEDGLPSVYIIRLIAPEDGGLWVVTNLGLRFWDGLALRRPAERGIAGIESFGSYDSMLNEMTLLEGCGLLLTKGDTPRLVTGARGTRPLPELRGFVDNLRDGWGSLQRREILLAGREHIVAWEEGRVQRRVVDKSFSAGGWIRTLMRDRRGTMWIRTTNALLEMRQLTDVPRVASGRESLGQPNYGVDLREDASGRVWTNTVRGLFWVRGHESGWLGGAQGLPESGGSFHFAFDPEDSLWVATEALLMQQGRFLWSNYGRQQGLPANMVWRIARGGDGRLWAVTQSRLAQATGDRWLPMPIGPDHAFFTVEPDSEGTLWFAGATSLPGGRPSIWVARAGDAWPRPEPLLGVDDPKVIWEVAFDRSGHIWLATQDQGLLRGRRTPQGWALENVAVPGWDPKEKISQIVAGPEGTLWAARAAGGIAVRQDDGGWQSFVAGDGIPREGVGVLKASPTGDVWASYTGERELNVFRRREGRWQVAQRIRAPHPLVQSVVLALAFEPDGTLMLGNSRGVLRWDGQRLEHYGRDWGMAGEDVAQAALWRDPNGDWWVGTTAGVSRFERAVYRPSPPVGPVRINEVLDGDGNVLPAAPGDVATRLPSSHLPLAFHFHPDGYLASLRATVQVRLVGLDDRWRTAAGLVAAYSSLAPGEYRFEVRLLGLDGRPGPVSHFAIDVLPPWYRTWWATTVWALGGVGLVVVVYSLRTRQLRRRAEHLETVVAARTSDLAKALQEVKTLRGLIPICMYCKKIRSDEGFWNQMEQYISEHTEARFSHGICPECEEQALKSLDVPAEGRGDRPDAG